MDKDLVFIYIMKKLILLVLISFIFIVVCGYMKGKSEMFFINVSPNTKEFLDGKPDFGKSMFSEKGWNENTIKEILKRDKGYFEIPKVEKYSNKRLVFMNRINDKMYEKAHIYSFEPNDDFDKIILYIHGGGYIFSLDSAHLKFCDNLCTLLNAKVCVPCYGVPPYVKCDETYDLLYKVYDDLLKFNKPIYIMGDSAGGGLGLAFTLDLKNKSRKPPKKIVLISPWLDVSMKNSDIEKYEKEDLMLSKYGLIEAGKLWAGDIDTDNYKVSPINGEINNLPPILITVGTKELFYPDIKLFYNKCEKNNVDCILIEAEEMFHAFPVLGSKLEESIKCMDYIINFVKETLIND